MILCCGDALIDMLPRALPDGTQVMLPATGGAAFNTAIALGRLGLPVGLFSGLSSDLFGRHIASDLSSAEVVYSFCPRADRPTTLAFVELSEGNARYTFYDENTASRLLRAQDLPDLSDAVSTLHFGALSLIQEPCGTTYESLLDREASRRVISLDPNIRPDFVRDEAAYRARIRRMVAKSDIVKVSDEDLAWIEPERSSSDVIEDWLAAGATIVAVTSGAGGAFARTANTSVSVSAVPVDVVDTIGAGDGFTAGLLAGLQHSDVLTKSALRQITDDQLREALELAAEVAAMIVSRAGADPPWRHEIPLSRRSAETLTRR